MGGRLVTLGMKNSYVAVVVLGSIAATAGIQEWRLGGKKYASETVLNVQPKRESAKSVSGDGVPERERPLTRIESDGGAEEEDEGFSKNIRKMWDNPAGKSMMSQGVKIAVAMMYEDFIVTLDLTDEEAEHFRELLGSEMATQQEVGMKIMSASPEERIELGKEIAERNKQIEEDIKTFLNNEEDHEAFKSYKDRLPEKQQLEGVRATMAAKNAAMDEETEGKLIEAMYKARTQPGLADFSGKNAYAEMGKEDMMENFEQTWESQQEMLQGEVGFLSEVQKEAFFEHQNQMKEFQMMGLKMAEQMMKPEAE